MGKQSRSVAIVDDDAAVRHALKFALESEGLQVHVHGKAPSLLADPNLHRYGCLVIDYRMPDIDGLELVDALRSRGVSAPIIMITGRANAGMRERAGRAGIDTILEKPLSGGALSTAVHSALSLPPAP